ncbi:hypothetical protein DIPPA_33278 [Diplonema papillatum]|nr:hypothetical protein DIPPA_33278 [Diplonema papillatum]
MEALSMAQLLRHELSGPAAPGRRHPRCKRHYAETGREEAQSPAARPEKGGKRVFLPNHDGPAAAAAARRAPERAVSLLTHHDAI